MRGIISIIFLVFSLSVFCQNVDTVKLKKDLIGEWELLYSLDIDTLEVVSDTIKDSLRVTIGLIINEKYVDEFWNFWDYPDDSTAYIGKGNWEIRYYSKEKSIWINFDCESVFLCGYYQFVSLKNDILILKSCSKVEYEGCQLDYFKRK